MDEKGNTQILEALDLAGPGEVAESPGRTYLLVLAGGIPGSLLPLSAGCNRIGRGPDNTIVLNDFSISRRHAELSIEASDRVVLVDLESTNGTYVNRHRLVPHRPVGITDGDRVRLGASVIVKFVRTDHVEEQFQKELFDRAVRDGLTGLYNRTYFLQQLGVMAQRAEASGNGLAVMMLDIDHFKRFNDEHGHDAGDAVLREVAHVLHQSTRSEDLVARFGGEEFLVALPSPSLDLALQRAERIRKRIASQPLRLQDGSVSVTASIGVAFTDANRSRAFDSLISTADLVLYRAKETGRNRVLGASFTARASSGEEVTSEAQLPVFPSSLANAVLPDVV